MSETVQGSGVPLRMRILFFAGDPLFAVSLLAASIFLSVLGAAMGKWVLAACGIALAVSGIGVLLLVVLISLEGLNARALGILEGITSLHDEEIKKLARPDQQPSGLKLGSLFRN